MYDIIILEDRDNMDNIMRFGIEEARKTMNENKGGPFGAVITDSDGYVAVGSYEASEEEHDNKVRSALIVKYDKKVLKYVVLHEFCHLKYKTHSKKFYELEKKYIGKLAEDREIYKNIKF